jgi:hypothetical protein
LALGKERPKKHSAKHLALDKEPNSGSEWIYIIVITPDFNSYASPTIISRSYSAYEHTQHNDTITSHF